MAVQIAIGPSPQGDIRVCGELPADIVLRAPWGIHLVCAPRYSCFRVGPVRVVQPSGRSEGAWTRLVSEARSSDELRRGDDALPETQQELCPSIRAGGGPRGPGRVAIHGGMKRNPMEELVSGVVIMVWAK